MRMSAEIHSMLNDIEMKLNNRTATKVAEQKIKEDFKSFKEGRNKIQESSILSENPYSTLTHIYPNYPNASSLNVKSSSELELKKMIEREIEQRALGIKNELRIMIDELMKEYNEIKYIKPEVFTVKEHALESKKAIVNLQEDCEKKINLVAKQIDDNKVQMKDLTVKVLHLEKLAEGWSNEKEKEKERQQPVCEENSSERISKLESKVGNISESLNGMSDYMNKIEINLSEIANNVNGYKSKILDLQDKCDNLSKENITLKKELSLSTNSNIDDEIKTIKTELKVIQSKEKNTAIADCASEIKSMKIEINELKNANKDKALDKEALNQLKEKVLMIPQTQNIHKENVNMLSERFDILKQEIERKFSDNLSYMKTHDAELKKLNEQIEMISQNQIQNSDKDKDKTSVLEEIDNINQNLAGQYSELKKEIIELKNSIKEKNYENELKKLNEKVEIIPHIQSLHTDNLKMFTDKLQNIRQEIEGKYSDITSQCSKSHTELNLLFTENIKTKEQTGLAIATQKLALIESKLESIPILQDLQEENMKTIDGIRQDLEKKYSDLVLTCSKSFNDLKGKIEEKVKDSIQDNEKNDATNQKLAMLEKKIEMIPILQTENKKSIDSLKEVSERKYNELMSVYSKGQMEYQKNIEEKIKDTIRATDSLSQKISFLEKQLQESNKLLASNKESAIEKSYVNNLASEMKNLEKKTEQMSHFYEQKILELFEQMKIFSMKYDDINTQKSQNILNEKYMDNHPNIVESPVITTPIPSGNVTNLTSNSLLLGSVTQIEDFKIDKPQRGSTKDIWTSKQNRVDDRYQKRQQQEKYLLNMKYLSLSIVELNECRNEFPGFVKKFLLPMKNFENILEIEFEENSETFGKGNEQDEENQGDNYYSGGGGSNEDMTPLDEDFDVDDGLDI